MKPAHKGRRAKALPMLRRPREISPSSPPTIMATTNYSAAATSSCAQARLPTNSGARLAVTLQPPGVLYPGSQRLSRSPSSTCAASLGRQTRALSALSKSNRTVVRFQERSPARKTGVRLGVLDISPRTKSIRWLVAGWSCPSPRRNIRLVGVGVRCSTPRLKLRQIASCVTVGGLNLLE